MLVIIDHRAATRAHLGVPVRERRRHEAYILGEGRIDVRLQYFRDPAT
jgi:hypothetical protein